MAVDKKRFDRAVEMRKHGGLYKDIAKEIGCSVSWCKSNISHIVVECGKGMLSTGSTYATTLNGDVEVLQDNGWDNVSVRFLDTGTECVARREDILKGCVKDYFAPSVFGVGYLGRGKHSPSCKGKPTSFVTAWRGILRRCYDSNFHKKRKSYETCTMDTSWHNFQVFAEWASSQVYFDGWEVDKDILVQGNKHYGPETCCFVPKRVNGLLTHIKSSNSGNTVGLGGPANAQYVYCHDGASPKYVGRAETSQQAENLYAGYKKSIILSVAEEFRGVVDEKVYSALLNYDVHKSITLFKEDLQ